VRIQIEAALRKAFAHGRDGLTELIRLVQSGRRRLRVTGGRSRVGQIEARFTPKSGHLRPRGDRQLRANKRHCGRRPVRIFLRT
jgi:hypothetical protein